MYGKRFFCLVVLLIGFVQATDTWDRSFPGMEYLHRTTNTPWDIHVLVIDLKQPGITSKVTLAQDQVYGREIVSQMAIRHGVTAAINGDFCSLNDGIPQGITVLDNVIATAPKFRTALGFTQNSTATIGMWTDRWNWYASVADEQGNEHHLVMMNLDVNADWLCLFTDLYGCATPGSSLSNNVVEVLVNADSLVQEIRENQPGLNIPSGSFVLTGRESAADWLITNISLGEQISLDLATLPDWRNLQQAVSGGPRFVANGAYYSDPMSPFPGGEDFTMSYKEAYYNSRQPRSAAGTTIDGDTLIFAVVDGRQSHSAGMTLRELASLMIEFGANDALQFDSGGSATFFLDGTVRNSPSDGSERPIANALCINSTQNFINIAPDATILSVSDELLPDHPASKLIDGDKSRSGGKWADLTSDIPWIELDLGSVYPLTHHQLFHASYAGDEAYLNTKEFKIYSRLDTNSAWEEDFHVDNARYQEQDNLCSYTEPKMARFVRLEILQSNHLDYEDYLRQPEYGIYIRDPEMAIDGLNESPNTFHVSQNFPNPFNPSTTLSYSLNEANRVKVTIYDMNGREIIQLLNEEQDRGSYEIRWQGMTSQQIQVDTGIYFTRFEVGSQFKTVKMVYLK